MIDKIEILQKQTSHVLHLLLSLITAGLWLPIWLLVACSNCSARNDIRKSTGLKPETNTAGAVLLVVFCLFVVVMVGR